MALSYRKTRQGSWAAYGPAAELHVGQVQVTTKKGTTKTEHVSSVSKSFSVGGVQHAYGYLQARSAQSEQEPETAPVQAQMKPSVDTEVVQSFRAERLKVWEALREPLLEEGHRAELVIRLDELNDGLQKFAGDARMSPPETERLRRQDPTCVALETSAGRLTTPCWLSYDIPDSADVANPSKKLRRIAVRINLSCWVISEDRIPYGLLNELREKGATWYVFRFDEKETAGLVNLAREVLTKDVKAAQQSLVNSEATAAQAAEEALANPETAESAAAVYQRRMKAAIKTAQVAAADYRNVAGLFGIDASRLGLESAVSAASALQSQLAKKCEAYAQMAAQARLLATQPNATAEAKGMAQAAAADDVPAEVLQDWLADQE